MGRHPTYLVVAKGDRKDVTKSWILIYYKLLQYFDRIGNSRGYPAGMRIHLGVYPAEKILDRSKIDG